MPLPYDLRRAHAAHRRAHDLANEAAMKAAAGPAENKAMAGPGENKGAEPNPLAEFSFASEQAADLAQKSAITPKQLRAVTPSSPNGYTVGDIRALIG